MDEARRFEDDDKAIMESLARENDYWKRVGGHPPVGHEDAPRVYECEHHNCMHRAMSVDEAPYGDMDQCQDCEGWYCPAHIGLDVTGHYAECHECHAAAAVDRVAVESDES